ncbi:MvaI/BcnI family restriction endonuclease [Metamycoplasma hominis]|uniref:MvaI/BcnI family restriction endonuclease n=1 Tax=Metamycoplasma hominis TaxID=2098 RepID=UPI002410D0AD|nr:MvaI/BcnI family restriction endonuclease [Metamycoplasma hominis]
MKKYRNKFVYAMAESIGTGIYGEFRYIEAYEMSGFDYYSFVELLEKGQIYVDLRIGQYHGWIKDGQTHDQGTGFRIKEIDKPYLLK